MIAKLDENRLAKDIRRTINKLIDEVASLRIASAPGMKVKRTAAGTVLSVGRVQTVNQTSGMNFRGEWSAGSSYSVGDVVVVRGGLSSGTYICVVTAPAGTAAPADPPVDPALGVYWISLARGNTSASW